MNISPLQKILILEAVIMAVSWAFFAGTLIDRDGPLPIIISGIWATAWTCSTVLIMVVGFPDNPKVEGGQMD